MEGSAEVCEDCGLSEWALLPESLIDMESGMCAGCQKAAEGPAVAAVGGCA